jgi:hypothetical protein
VIEPTRGGSVLGLLALGMLARRRSASLESMRQTSRAVRDFAEVRKKNKKGRACRLKPFSFVVLAEGRSL